MRALPLLLLLAPQFWDVRSPGQWTEKELLTLLSESPWAQTLGPPSSPVIVLLATAAPVERAEAELRLRGKIPAPELDPDYTLYVKEHRDTEFVLAIPYPKLSGLGDAKEEKLLEEESVMKIGRRTYHIIGHFPPTPSDPVLRLIFPREVRPDDKTVLFRLYLPGLPFPEREAQFSVKDLYYQNALEM
jgi:hypothetical protein